MIPGAALLAAKDAWTKELLRLGHWDTDAAMRAALRAAAPFIAEEALLEAADEMTAVIACGDVAEVAAPVDGESGRQEAVWARDGLYEEPNAWLVKYAASLDSRGA